MSSLEEEVKRALQASSFRACTLSRRQTFLQFFPLEILIARLASGRIRVRVRVRVRIRIVSHILSYPYPYLSVRILIVSYLVSFSNSWYRSFK